MLEKLIIFVEEYSMEAALERLLPKLLGDVAFEIFRFQFSTKSRGLPKPSVMAWIWVPNRPRDRPSASASGLLL